MKIKILLLLFAICNLSFVICNSPAIAGDLDEAYQDYLSGAHEDAIDKARMARSCDEKIYLIGLCNFKLAEYSLARDNFSELISEYPDSMRYEPSLIKIADSYLLEDEFARARELYENLKGNKRSAYLPLIYLRLAQVANKQGRWSDKRHYLGLVKSKFPRSSEMRYVKILESYDEYFTIQVGAFGSQRNASALKRTLSKKGYPVYLVRAASISGKVYKVRIGRYSSRQRAKRIALKLMDLGYPTRIYP